MKPHCIYAACGPQHSPTNFFSSQPSNSCSKPPSPPLRPMDRKPTEPKRTGKEKSSFSPATMIADGDAADDEEEELDDKKRRSCSASNSVTVARRGPGAAPSSQQPACQAEKCSADLSEAKRYHRRHKVCEAHSKAPVVIVAGLRQRFCQQCSRFHELSEFDEAKRSCRRRLAGHNERRRKSSTDQSQGDGSDQGGSVAPMSFPGSAAYKHFQIQ